MSDQDAQRQQNIYSQVSVNKHQLDEPICTTVVNSTIIKKTKDLRSIFLKTRFAMLPFSNDEKLAELRDCN